MSIHALEQPLLATARLRAMGSDAHIIVVGGRTGLLDRAIARVELLESRWSRFRDTSEVSALNRHAGAEVDVSPDTLLLIERSIELWRLTGGSVDPLVLHALEAAGYDHSFEVLVELSSRPARAANPLPWAMVACTDIALDRATRSVRLPAGTGFDPGGIGKGLAADLIVAELLADGAAGACVNLGGDVRVAGLAPQDGGWTISVEHPLTDEALVMLDLTSGAVTTSSTVRRTWTVGERQRHHLIDPQTGRPSATDLVQATVVAGQAWVGEGLAKAVLLRGADRAFDLMPDGVEAMAIDRDGNVTTTDGFERFAVDANVPTKIALVPRTNEKP